jgi:hypothetical protein
LPPSAALATPSVHDERTARFRMHHLNIATIVVVVEVRLKALLWKGSEKRKK